MFDRTSMTAPRRGRRREPRTGVPRQCSQTAHPKSVLLVSGLAWIARPCRPGSEMRSSASGSSTRTNPAFPLSSRIADRSDTKRKATAGTTIQTARDERKKANAAVTWIAAFKNSSRFDGWSLISSG